MPSVARGHTAQAGGGPLWLQVLNNSLAIIVTLSAIFTNASAAARLLNGRDLADAWLLAGGGLTAAAICIAVLARWIISNRFWKGFAAGNASMAIAALCVLSFLYFTEGRGNALARIDQPRNGDLVNVEVIVAGDFSRFPEDESIWIVVAPLGLDEELFFPQNGPAEKSYDGRFEGSALVGLDDPADYGRRFKILVVAAGGDAQEQFRDYLIEGRNRGSFPGQEALPAGSRLMDDVTVTRRTPR